MIFDLCEPRADVLKGVTDADFAADLAKVIRGVAPEEYLKPDKFFATTLSDSRPPELTGQRLCSAYGNRERGRVDFPPGYQLRRWQDAWPDRIGARRERHARRLEHI